MMSTFVASLLFGFILTALFLLNHENPELTTTDIQIISYNPTVEKTLGKFEMLIGDDYQGYKNHIYRVLTYSMHFLHGNATCLTPIATALVYHDIGLWTDSVLAYIDPSCDIAAKDLKDDSSFSSEELQLIHDIIYWHHKFTPFEGANHQVVEAVRRADWIDATMGIINQGMPRSAIRTVQKSIENAGFHATLLGFGPRLHGYNVYKIVTEISKIFRH